MKDLLIGFSEFDQIANFFNVYRLSSAYFWVVHGAVEQVLAL